jgi:hypothetical protein
MSLKRVYECPSYTHEGKRFAFSAFQRADSRGELSDDEVSHLGLANGKPCSRSRFYSAFISLLITFAIETVIVIICRYRSGDIATRQQCEKEKS